MTQKMNFKQVLIRVDPKIVKELDQMSIDHDSDRTSIIRYFIAEGLIRFKSSGILFKSNKENIENNLTKETDDKGEKTI